MMRFIAKKILGLSYGIATCAMISCSVFGANLPEDDSRLNRLEELVNSYPPHLSHLVTAHEADITNHTTRIDSHETHIQAIQALTTRFETQITELTTQLQTLSARFELLERNARPPAPPVAVIANPLLGNEAIYERFLRGKLIYRPTAGSDVGRIELPIASLLNPLESTFDLSRCDDAATYLSISTGYKKAKIPANANKSEVWIVPKFVVGRDAATAPAQYREIIEGWDGATAPFALFFTWGGHDHLEWYDYLTTRTPEQIGASSLYDNWTASIPHSSRRSDHGAPLRPFDLYRFLHSILLIFN